jgi:hypothetical protein
MAFRLFGRLSRRDGWPGRGSSRLSLAVHQLGVWRRGPGGLGRPERIEFKPNGAYSRQLHQPNQSGPHRPLHRPGRLCLEQRPLVREGRRCGHRQQIQLHLHRRRAAQGLPSGVVWNQATEARSGGAVGTGLEFGFAPNWSVGVEYDHLFMGTNNVTFPEMQFSPNQFAVSRSDNIRQDVDMGTVRVNYHFGGPYRSQVGPSLPTEYVHAIGTATSSERLSRQTPVVAATAACLRLHDRIVGVSR